MLVNHKDFIYRSVMYLTAIVADISDLYKNGVDRVAVIIEDYGGSGDQAWRRGNFTTYTKDNKIFSTGK